MSVLDRIRVPTDGSVCPALLVGRNSLRLVLGTSVALGMLACAAEQSPTEASGSPSYASAATAAGPSVAVHPSKNLDPDGRTVTVIGKGFPASITVELSECTGFPLTCQVLSDVNTNGHGMFISRVLVAFDFTAINPFPPVPTCSAPCSIYATVTTPPFASTFEPLTFSE
jgi:hypothetical protein